MKCKYNDCGWCYAKRCEASANDDNGRCNNPNECPEYIRQQEEYNIACDMEPVSVFDATAHTNSEWPDEQQSAEWNGEGLPPVGTECEYYIDTSGRWDWCEIVGYRDGVVFFISTEVDEGLPDVYRRTAVHSDFRPISTEEQQAADERSTLINIIQSVGEMSEGVLADAILSAGYHLTDKD